MSLKDLHLTNIHEPRKHPLVLPLLVLWTCLLLVRMFFFIHRYAVNILYTDQWDFYTPLFQKMDLWSTFTWQHGPHRQGLGLIITSFLAELTGWNSEADAMTVGISLGLATVCALRLKYRLFGALSISDIAIPLVCLNLFQYEALVVVPNLSYGALPLAMILAFCLALQEETSLKKYASIVILNFLLVYTGFGIMMGPIALTVLSADTYQSRNDPRRFRLAAVSLLLSFSTMLSFLVDYHFDSGISNFGFSVTYLFQYPLFIGLMLATSLGWHHLILGQIAVYAGIVLLVVFVAAYSSMWTGVARLKRVDLGGRSTTLIVLMTYTLLFCANAAVGRTPLGLFDAQVSRYITLMIPGYLALYFFILGMSNVRLRRVCLLLFVCLSAAGSLPIEKVNNLPLNLYTKKTRWKTEYLKLLDVDKCNTVTSFQIHPEAAAVKNKLAYLRDRRLNLFTPPSP